MIKKITLATVATLALIAMPAQAESMKCQAGKCGAKMAKPTKPANMMNKSMKQKSSPFLIKKGLPHATGLIMQKWDDPKLALTPEQKEKLLVVRKETMEPIMKLKPEVMALEQEIIQASKAGTKASELKAKVDKLASLEAELTMVHLRCLDNTNTILNEVQHAYLMEDMKKEKRQMKSMKCASGKCGGKQ